MMKISSLLLVLVVAIGTMGVNILSFCCNHKEVSLFTVVDHAHSETFHSTHSNLHDCYSSTTDFCCKQVEASSHSCCNSHAEAGEDDCGCHNCNPKEPCMKNDFVQLKPVKNTDYVVSFLAPLPIIIELFCFNPAVCSSAPVPLLAYYLPPGDEGREILAKNAILLI